MIRVFVFTIETAVLKAEVGCDSGKRGSPLVVSIAGG